MSFTSRLEGLLQNVGLGAVVGEVRAMLGLARDNTSPRNEVVGQAPPPRPAPAPAQTVVERTPRPRPVSEPVAREPVSAEAPEAEPPAPAKAAPAGRAKAKKARPVKRGKAPARNGAEAAAPKAGKATASRSRPKAKKAARTASESAAPQDASVVVARLVEALRAHPRHEALVTAGRQKDQLVRSLIPLYLARAVEADVEVTSGTMSRFWGELGVTYAAPNAAKALRLHSGYAQDTKKGKAITPRGIQYVEQALERVREPASR